MTGGAPQYECAGPALLRMPVHPACRAEETRLEPVAGTGGEAEALADCLRRLADDPLVAEAVAVSSPTPAAAIDATAGRGRRCRPRPYCGARYGH